MGQSQNIELAGDYYEGEIDGVRVFMKHYPKYADLATKSNDYDLVIHGHTHEYRSHEYRLENINNTVGSCKASCKA